MLILQVTDIRHRLRKHGFNPQVLSDRLVVAVGHLIYGDQVEGISMTQGVERLRIDEGDLPRLVKQAKGLLSYDFDPRRRKQNQWWFVQGMPVLPVPKGVIDGPETPVEEFLNMNLVVSASDGQRSARAG